MNNQIIKVSISTFYDMQKLRIQNGNRIVAAFRVKLGLQSSEAEETEEKASELLKSLRGEFKRVTDGVKRITKAIKFDSPLITTYGELALIESYERMLEAEHIHEKAIIDELSRQLIYTAWLSEIRGVGPLMAGVILSEIDITKCNSISALHKYCGLDVVVKTDEATGEILEEGRCRKAHHLIDKQYTNRDGEIRQTKGITFNPFLKTKMIGVLGSSFIKCGGPYREIYDDYKHRLEHHPKHKDKTKAHKNNMAIRYMIKFFLSDLWTVWRTIEGLPVRGTYAEDKLGLVHSKPKAIDEWLAKWHELKKAA